MVYITGTITDSNPGPALHALMAPALTSAGYTLVDTVVISTRTHKVWKSPAAGNVQNLDWYLDISYQTVGAANFAMQPFEFYDPATDLGYRGPQASSSTIIDAATSTRYGAVGYALETNWTGTAAGMGTALPVTSFAYWASITLDRVIMLNSNEPTRLIYTGFYLPDPLYAAKAGAALYPLVQARMLSGSSANSNSSGGLLLPRIPPATAMGTNGWNYHAYSHLDTERFRFPPIPSGPFTSYPAAAVPVLIKNHSSSGNSTSPPDVTHGQFLDLAITAATATVNRGDTVTIASASWVLSSMYNDHSLLFKAA